MLLGKITGKVTTNDFKFLITSETKKFEYVQVHHKLYDDVLCQVIDIHKDGDKTIGYCQIIGYKENNRIRKPRVPFEPESEVLLAKDEYIKEIIKLEESKAGALIGNLDGRNIKVNLDLNKVLTMHMAVLAKSGSGKSYAVGVLLEEIIQRKIPVVVIDPHGEYSSMKHKNENEEDILALKEYSLEPKALSIFEYADTSLNPNTKPLVLNKNINGEELMHLLPGKLSGNQQAVLYSSLKNSQTPSFDSLLLSLEEEESNAKFSVISMVEYLRGLDIFDGMPTPYNELVKPGSATILNLKGINPDVQELIAYKISTDLFELRKKNKVPPFFLVIEEAHNYCPERSFGEAKSSKILRNIASEGRKFGLGLCIISQRPARVDKSVLSQCTTQIILKITNPNDLKAVSNSIEGITSSTEKEIQNLPIGTAIVTGLTQVPLLVNIRPRQTSHGGKAQDIVNSKDEFLEHLESFNEEELLPVIKPNITPKDMSLMSESKPTKIETKLIPCIMASCKDNEGNYNILINMINGEIITDKDTLQSKKIPDMSKLSKIQINILKYAHKNNSFEEQDLIQAIGGSVDLKEDLDLLKMAGYLLEENDKYLISNNHVFSKLNKVANFDKIQYEPIKYVKKEDTVINIDELLTKLSKFTNILDRNDCFLVNYEATY